MPGQVQVCSVQKLKCMKPWASRPPDRFHLVGVVWTQRSRPQAAQPLPSVPRITERLRSPLEAQENTHESKGSHQGIEFCSFV